MRLQVEAENEVLGKSLSIHYRLTQSQSFRNFQTKIGRPSFAVRLRVQMIIRGLNRELFSGQDSL